MHHSHSSHQRTTPHLEALPSNKSDLPTFCPETTRRKSCTEDVKKLRARPRRPDMQLYVPRARRGQVTPGTSIPMDAHSSESVQNSQINSRCSNVPLEVTQNCSRLVPHVRQTKSEKRNHLFQSSFEHQEYGSETENLSESDNPNFKRSNQIKDVKSSSSQFLQKCSETILYSENSVEDKNILNAQDDCEKLIVNQNCSILSKELHIANLPEVPDFALNEFVNQKEENDIPKNSHSALLVEECEVEPDICNPSVCLDTALVEDKLDSSPDLHQEREVFPEENGMQSELIETKGLNDECLSTDSEQLQTDTDIGKQESSVEGKESIFVNRKEPSTQIVKNIMQCKDCVSKSEMKNVEHWEGKNAEMKYEDIPNDSLSENNTDIDSTSQHTQTETASDSSDIVDKSKSTNDDSWDSLFDDSGECLNPEILKELTTTVGNVKITKSKYNYYEFQPHEPDVSGDEFGHIVEFYDFPVEFKNQDLLAIFSAFKNEAFNIKWVDDTHALGVFSSPSAAMDALSLNHPLLKVRPLSQGIRESKFKAKRCAEFLQPYKPRPATSASIARRLVSGALGVKVQIPKEQRELERKKLQEAKDRRRQAAKQKQDIWDGVVS